MNSENFVSVLIPNNPLNRLILKHLRKQISKEYTLRTFGRCKDKKKAFARTGRFYNHGQSNYNSIYSLNSPQAPYCYAWRVYIKRKNPKA